MIIPLEPMAELVEAEDLEQTLAYCPGVEENLEAYTEYKPEYKEAN